jgi:hypothetical protein
MSDEPPTELRGVSPASCRLRHLARRDLTRRRRHLAFRRAKWWPPELPRHESPALRAGYSAFRRPLLSLPAGMLDDRAQDADQMQSIVESLPVNVWMTTEITPLTEHPSDPATTRT